jgi:hypothetical protein
MTEQNCEEFEGFEDIWSAILDERVLIKLSEKIDLLAHKAIEEQKIAAEEKLKKPDERKSESATDSDSPLQKKNIAEAESPSNFKLIDYTI